MTQALDEYQERRRLEQARKRTRSDRTPYAARAAKIKGRPCRKCPSTYRIEYHHIIPRARLGGSEVLGDEANAMPLCHDCHQHHHTTVEGRVPRHLLEPAELAFVLEHTSEAWAALWYPEAAA